MIQEQQLAEAYRAVDPWYWAYYNNIILPTGPFLLEGHEYQVELLQSEAQKECAIKGAQMTFTMTDIIKTTHGMIYGKYPQGVMYVFPTTKTGERFSQSRFTPLIHRNPHTIGCYVSKDNVELKRISDSNLYFVGSRSTSKIDQQQRSTVALKSEPVDKLTFDEYDEHDMDMIPKAKERMSHSEIQEEVYLSTPSIPGFGIDELYGESDQRIWMIKCEHCGKETCLELEFPNCLKERADGSIYRSCIHCGEEIYPHNGHWVARYPDRSKDMVGRWISQLNSKYINPIDILGAFNDPQKYHTTLTDVYNYKLAMAYVASENKLKPNDIYNICSWDVMLTKHPGPCCMGVDVGTLLHIVIAYHPNDVSLKAVKFATVSSFNDVHDLAKRFNVECAVIDREPEIRKAREFQESEDYEIFLCDYQEEQRHAPAFNSKSGLVIINRTEICDASHNLITIPGRYVIPRRNKEVERYALEMSNLAKVLEENPETGSKSYFYRKVGADHYRHATNYMLLAAMRIGVYEPEDEGPKDKWSDGFEDKETGNWMSE